MILWTIELFHSSHIQIRCYHAFDLCAIVMQLLMSKFVRILCMDASGTSHLNVLSLNDAANKQIMLIEHERNILKDMNKRVIYIYIYTLSPSFCRNFISQWSQLNGFSPVSEYHRNLSTEYHI